MAGKSRTQESDHQTCRSSKYKMVMGFIQSVGTASVGDTIASPAIPLVLEECVRRLFTVLDSRTDKVTTHIIRTLPSTKYRIFSHQDVQNGKEGWDRCLITDSWSGGILHYHACLSSCPAGIPWLPPPTSSGGISAGSRPGPARFQ